jgi:protease-4
MTSSKNRTVWGMIMIVFLFFILLLIFAAYTMKNLTGGEGVSFQRGGDKHSIAVIEVNGAIMESKGLIELLQVAEEDKAAGAIILRINSPGGAVGPTQEIYEEIRRIDESYTKSKGKEGKPIYASFSSIAASGGYYLGAATRKIYSNPGTITGSIGVIMQFIDASKLYELAKVRQINIKAGKYKDIGQPNRSITQEEKMLLESMIDGVHEQFISDIERTRKGKIKKDIRTLAQGQIFSGEQAHKLGLVDELKGLWQAGRQIHKDLKLEGEFGFRFVKKNKKKGLWGLIDNLEEVSTNLNEISSKLNIKKSQTSLLFKCRRVVGTLS